jgi:hypothetical protein
MRLLALSMVVFLSCGLGSDPTSGPKGQTSTAALCGTQPQDNGDGTVTAVGCPFEQQYDNILHHGQRLASTEQLHSGATTPGVSVTNTCGEWLLGTDPAGIVVFVSNASGEVRSHGQMHPGFATSSLPAKLSLPIAAQ